MAFPKPMSQEEMLAAVTELDQALYIHEQWSEEVNAALICRLRPDGRDVADDSYRQCCFGQWYYGVGAEKLVGHPGFTEVEMEHKRMHQYAAGLLRAASAGPPIALQDYERYTAAPSPCSISTTSRRSMTAAAVWSISPAMCRRISGPAT